MNKLKDNKLYLADLEKYSNLKFIDWNQLINKTIMITGATGLIGRYFIDLIMYKNKTADLKCKILAVGRNVDKARNIFSYFENEYFEFISHNVVDKFEYEGKIDYIIHCASNTSPIQYATDPIGTIETNVFGTKNLLDLSISKRVNKFIFVSSFEVYGQLQNLEKISEHDYGVIDNTILRSCYPESKRLSESLCIAYSEQMNVNSSIVRLSRVFGPTMNVESTLSITQFIKSGLNKENIVLKSDGEQLYSYNYVGDAVTAIIKVMLDGGNREAYNVADEKFDGKLKDFAKNVANYVNKDVVFDLPTDIEKKGFSNSTMTILNSEKLKSTGWYAVGSLQEKIATTIDVLSERD